MNSGKVTATLKLLIIAIMLILQILILFFAVHFLRQYFAFIYTVLEILSMVMIIVLISRRDNQIYKFSWATIVALLSVTGLLIYLMWGRTGNSKKAKQDMDRVLKHSSSFAHIVGSSQEQLETQYPSYKRFSKYLQKEGFEPFSNTDAAYFPSGEEKFEALFQDMERAERFIFLEYFIVFEGTIFERLYDILRRKAQQGVEVRFIYDDAGSIFTTSKSLLERFKQDGIKHQIFNPMNRYVDKLYFNYRNHQKIAVIDGNIGYCGGINIADEYANLYEKHGHWKDSAIRLKGDAVWGLTRIFLEMWEFSGGFITEDYSIYAPQKSSAANGFFQPFADGPLNNPHNPAEAMYCQMISNSKDYVYITTPYLALDETLIKAMITAAQSGIDIRIITPKVFDHWYTKNITQSYYETLLKEGVRIFEYTPGFMHSKTIVSDGESAIVGSINLDYRSFFLHYECGVWMCGAPVIEDILKDYKNIFEESKEISFEKWEKRTLIQKYKEALIQVFAPII